MPLRSSKLRGIQEKWCFCHISGRGFGNKTTACHLRQPIRGDLAETARERTRQARLVTRKRKKVLLQTEGLSSPANVAPGVAAPRNYAAVFFLRITAHQPRARRAARAEPSGGSGLP